jgi:hypothetical protein
MLRRDKKLVAACAPITATVVDHFTAALTRIIREGADFC